MQKSGVGTQPYLPLISVIVPVYNVAKILERCINSIRQQIYPNLEIILVDDGSTDMSGTFCDVFAKQDQRIKVIHQPNQGLSMARNAGLKLATGKWVTFVDSDDTIHPDMIDLLHRLCYQNKTKMSICGFYEVKAEGTGSLKPHQPSQERVLTTVECLKAMLCEEGFSMSAWGKLYARELFDLVEFPPHRLYEDVGTTYKLVLQCDHIAVSNAEYYNYYQTPGSITQQSFNLKKLDLIDLTDQMCDDIIAWSQTSVQPATPSSDLTQSSTSVPQPSPQPTSFTPADRALLTDLTKKRRMHARFSVLRQMVTASSKSSTASGLSTPQSAASQAPSAPLSLAGTSIDSKSLKHAEKQVIKYLRSHKNYILKNPLATRRDRLAMYSLLAGKPIFRYAWKKYASVHK